MGNISARNRYKKKREKKGRRPLFFREDVL